MPTPMPIETFTTKRPKVDPNASADMNAVQTSIVNIETALNKLINTNGTLVQGTSFPGSPSIGQTFYRTDLLALYFFNGTAWQSPQNLSNVLFQYQGQIDAASSISAGCIGGEFLGSTLNAVSGAANYRYLVGGDGITKTFSTKYVHITGISTVTVFTRIWDTSGTSTSIFTLKIGLLSGTATIASSTPTWVSFTIDVTSLTPGTSYDVGSVLQSGAVMACANIIGFGS